jgi:hypothetical protein
LCTFFLFRNLKEKITSYTTLTLNKKTSLIFILTFTTIAVVDSTIVKFSTYSGVEFPSSLHLAIFVIFSIIFVASSTGLLNSVRKITLSYAYKPTSLGLRYFHGIIVATLILTVAIILIIIFQMILLNKYSLNLLRVQTYLSHLSSLIFLSFLIFLFEGWLKLKRNYIIVLFTISFSLVSANLVISLIYLESYFSSSAALPDARPYPIISSVTNTTPPNTPFSADSLSTVFDVLSLSSFLVMWIATAILLSQYRYRMGRIKYFSLMSIPLIYYIFPLQGYFGDVFFSLLESSPISYSIIYILIFSATKQLGALLFSLTFWTASTLVYDDRVRKSLLISSIGMAILFGTFEISPLQYHVYPPYGFITQAFIPLGAYLLLVGIFTSAKVISRDTAVRKEFYKSASSQLSLLKTIGVSQMEKELEKQIKSVEGKFVSDETTTYDIPQLEEKDVKEILREILNELYYSKNKKEEEDN